MGPSVSRRARGLASPVPVVAPAGDRLIIPRTTTTAPVRSIPVSEPLAGVSSLPVLAEGLHRGSPRRRGSSTVDQLSTLTRSVVHLRRTAIGSRLAVRARGPGPPDGPTCSSLTCSSGTRRSGHPLPSTRARDRPSAGSLYSRLCARATAPQPSIRAERRIRHQPAARSAVRQSRSATGPSRVPPNHPGRSSDR